MEEKILRFVNNLNNSWFRENCENIEEYFDNSAVLTLPDLSKNISGVEPIAASYRDFVSQAEVLSLNTGAHSLYRDRDRFIFIYDFDISYKMNGKKYDEKGRETLYIKNGIKGLKIFWRCINYF